MPIKDIYFSIKLNKDSIRSIESKIGGNIGRCIADRVEQKIRPGLQRYAIEAENALKSKVPYDTGELRNSFIITETKKSGLQYDVGIASGLHVGRDRKSASASVISKLLNIGGNSGTWKRSTYSRPAGKYSAIGKGQPTKDWISLSVDQFRINRGKILG